MYKNDFSLLWKSHGVNFNTAIEELKLNFKLFDNYKSDERVKSFIKYVYKPKKFNLN